MTETRADGLRRLYARIIPRMPDGAARIFTLAIDSGLCVDTHGMQGLTPAYVEWHECYSDGRPSDELLTLLALDGWEESKQHTLAHLQCSYRDCRHRRRHWSKMVEFGPPKDSAGP